MALLNEYEAYEEPAFFDCGAVELAKKLLGKCLYCDRSGILVRIVETEAYPYGDEVYRKLFGGLVSYLPQKAGVVVQCLSRMLNLPVLRSLAVRDGRTAYTDTIEERLFNESIVGTIAYSRKNLLIHPDIVAKALKGDWESNPVLYNEGGIQLYRKKGERERIEMLHAPRVLLIFKSIREFYQEPLSGGVKYKYRFALDYDYNYAEWRAYEKMT